MVPEIVNPLGTPWPKKNPLNLRVCQVKSRRDFRKKNWAWVSLSDLINEINYAFQIGMETWIGVSRVSTWVRRTRRRMKTTTLHQSTSKEIRINQIKERWHNSPIYDECQTQSAWVLALPWERTHQDDSNDTPQPICEFQVNFPLLWIKDYPGLS